MNVPVDGSARAAARRRIARCHCPCSSRPSRVSASSRSLPARSARSPGWRSLLALRQVGPWWAEGAALVLLFIAGVWAANAAETHFGRIDPGPVVIDEVVGMLITTLFLPLTWTGWLVGFVIFRACDVVKPFPGRAGRAAARRTRRDVTTSSPASGAAIMRGLLWAFPGWL